MYTPTEVQMAHEMAEALHDKKSMYFYLSCTKKYPAQFLRTTLTHVMGLPDHAVRTTRARLFTNIVRNSLSYQLRIGAVKRIRLIQAGRLSLTEGVIKNLKDTNQLLREFGKPTLPLDF